jgi:hypothetical protein
MSANLRLTGNHDRACVMSTPAAFSAAGVKRTPSTASTMGMARKKDMMVMRLNRLMLSMDPCLPKERSKQRPETHSQHCSHAPS